MSDSSRKTRGRVAGTLTARKDGDAAGAAKGSAAGRARPPVRSGKPPRDRSVKPSFPAATRPEPLAAPVAAPRKPVAARDPLPAAEPPASGVRVSKLMAERGLCSRREADSYIERGWVFVDGQRVTELGTRADPAATITLAPEARVRQNERITILLHKPVGYVSGQPEPGYEPAVALVGRETQWREAGAPPFQGFHLKGLAPAGRLDIDSTGLLVLTQDGRIARQLIGDDSEIEKEYLVRVNGELSDDGMRLLNHGLSLDGRKLRPAKVSWQNEDQLRFVLREGRKRQIRRMCELVGLHVVGLKRVRIGRVRLGDLPLGQWRYLRPDESF